MQMGQQTADNGVTSTVDRGYIYRHQTNLGNKKQGNGGIKRPGIRRGAV
jgi:hypothetical protein